MHFIETGVFLGRLPYVKVGTGPNPILVINGGQGFMMIPDDRRILKDARRLTRVLPDNRSFILLGYDPDAAKVTLDASPRMYLTSLTSISAAERMSWRILWRSCRIPPRNAVAAERRQARLDGERAMVLARGGTSA